MASIYILLRSFLNLYYISWDLNLIKVVVAFLAVHYFLLLSVGLLILILQNWNNFFTHPLDIEYHLWINCCQYWKRQYDDVDAKNDLHSLCLRPAVLRRLVSNDLFLIGLVLLDLFQVLRAMLKFLDLLRNLVRLLLGIIYYYIWGNGYGITSQHICRHVFNDSPIGNLVQIKVNAGTCVVGRIWRISEWRWRKFLVNYSRHYHC